MFGLRARRGIYLESDKHSYVSHLAFSDLLYWSGRLDTLPGPRIDTTSSVPSGWTALLEIAFTLLSLFAVSYLLYDTFEKARQYYLDNVGKLSWRSSMRIADSTEEIAAIRRQPFLTTVFPNYVHMGVIVAGIVLSCLVIGYGSILLATALYAVLVFIVWPAFRHTRTFDEPKEPTKGSAIDSQ